MTQMIVIRARAARLLNRAPEEVADDLNEARVHFLRSNLPIRKLLNKKRTPTQQSTPGAPVSSSVLASSPSSDGLQPGIPDALQVQPETSSSAAVSVEPIPSLALPSSSSADDLQSGKPEGLNEGIPDALQEAQQGRLEAPHSRHEAQHEITPERGNSKMNSKEAMAIMELEDDRRWEAEADAREGLRIMADPNHPLWIAEREEAAIDYLNTLNTEEAMAEEAMAEEAMAEEAMAEERGRRGALADVGHVSPRPPPQWAPDPGAIM
jgi:hypothetical protein